MGWWTWHPGAIARSLRHRGVLGINRRNADYVLGCNARRFYPRVDDKLQTKRICRENGIRVPETYAVISRQGDIRRFADIVATRPDFVVKPAKGSGGRGIIVVAGRDRSDFKTSSGAVLPAAEIRYHLSTILSGLYSLGGQPDTAMIEQRIVRHPAFASIAIGGTPDIRIILYRCVPVMAMVRLPTELSRGRANLHQGAVAAAIDLVSGQTFGGVWRNRPIESHPDTGATIRGIAIPQWQDLVLGAMRLADGVGLGYLGVDFVLDAVAGPVVLEANARPGLAIQAANRRGLLKRLQWIDTHMSGPTDVQRRLEAVRQLNADD